MTDPSDETEPLANAASGNRWEPDAAPPPPDPETPAASGAATAPTAATRGERLRRLLARPGRPTWLSGAAAALLVFVGAGGFVAGRASVDEHGGPTQVDQGWHRPGPQLGDDDRQYDGDDGTGDGTGDGSADDPSLGRPPTDGRSS